MTNWIKTTTGDGAPIIMTDTPLPENRARKEGRSFLHNVCGSCTHKNKGSYGFFMAKVLWVQERNNLTEFVRGLIPQKLNAK